MKTIDRRRLIGAILCGAGAGLVLAPGALAAMPIDTKLPGRASTISSRRRKPSWCMAAAGVAAAGSAGGIEAVADAVGAGYKTQKRIGATAPRLMPRTDERGDVAVALAGELRTLVIIQAYARISQTTRYGGVQVLNRKPRDVATTAWWEFALEFEERPATRRAHPTLRNLVFTRRSRCSERPR